LALVVAQGLLGLTIQRWLPALADSDYGFRLERLEHRRASSAEQPLTIVMFGSSRTFFGFDAQSMQIHLGAQLPAPCVVHNFGVPGAGPVHDRLHLERLLADGIHLDLVLLEVTPALLVSGTGIPPEQEHVSPTRLRRRELAVLEQYHLPTQAARADWWQRWVVPCYYYRFGLVSAVSPSLLPTAVAKHLADSVDEACWRPLTPPGAEAAEVDAVLRTYGAALQMPLCEASCQALQDTVKLCRREHLRVALVWMPEASCFRALYPPETITAVRHLLQQLEQTYGVPLIDASAWIDDEQFSNPHYLFTTGAATLADRLSHAVVPLLACEIPGS
jgi:hypothetical protein